MLEFRPDAPIGQLLFWSTALVVWLVYRVTHPQDKGPKGHK